MFLAIVKSDGLDPGEFLPWDGLFSIQEDKI